MSTPFPITIGGKAYQVLPPSFAFQKAHKQQIKQLEAGQMSDADWQDYMAEVIVHCVQRVTPGIDAAAIEADLDYIEITRLSIEIGQQTQKQVAAAMGVDSLGEAKTGEA